MINYNIKDSLIEIEVKGKISTDDYKDFLPVIDSLIKDNKKPSFLIKLEDFKGWESSAMWEELKYDMKHRNDFGPMAVVGESNVQKLFTYISSLVFPSEIKYFDREKENEARKWIESKIS